jgi:hypothetical protein
MQFVVYALMFVLLAMAMSTALAMLIIIKGVRIDCEHAFAIANLSVSNAIAITILICAVHEVKF